MGVGQFGMSIERLSLPKNILQMMTARWPYDRGSRTPLWNLSSRKKWKNLFQKLGMSSRGPVGVLQVSTATHIIYPGQQSVLQVKLMDGMQGLQISQVPNWSAC
ncbi:UNVERIFIED_CONTAM: hypothetical protein FKN15_020938 [Acipenser sinensis]